jgi:hypothetical protein
MTRANPEQLRVRTIDVDMGIGRNYGYDQREHLIVCGKIVVIPMWPGEEPRDREDHSLAA